MVLVEKLKQAEALEVGKVAPDIARTAASSQRCSLKQIADDSIRPWIVPWRIGDAIPEKSRLAKCATWDFAGC